MAFRIDAFDEKLVTPNMVAAKKLSDSYKFLSGDNQSVCLVSFFLGGFTLEQASLFSWNVMCNTFAASGLVCAPVGKIVDVADTFGHPQTASYESAGVCVDYVDVPRRWSVQSNRRLCFREVRFGRIQSRYSIQ